MGLVEAAGVAVAAAVLEVLVRGADVGEDACAAAGFGCGGAAGGAAAGGVVSHALDADMANVATNAGRRKRDNSV